MKESIDKIASEQQQLSNEDDNDDDQNKIDQDMDDVERDLSTAFENERNIELTPWICDAFANGHSPLGALIQIIGSPRQDQAQSKSRSTSAPPGIRFRISDGHCFVDGVFNESVVQGMFKRIKSYIPVHLVGCILRLQHYMLFPNVLHQGIDIYIERATIIRKLPMVLNFNGLLPVGNDKRVEMILRRTHPKNYYMENPVLSNQSTELYRESYVREVEEDEVGMQECMIPEETMRVFTEDDQWQEEAYSSRSTYVAPSPSSAQKKPQAQQGDASANTKSDVDEKSKKIDPMILDGRVKNDSVSQQQKSSLDVVTNGGRAQPKQESLEPKPAAAAQVTQVMPQAQTQSQTKPQPPQDKSPIDTTAKTLLQSDKTKPNTQKQQVQTQAETTKKVPLIKPQVQQQVPSPTKPTTKTNTQQQPITKADQLPQPQPQTKSKTVTKPTPKPQAKPQAQPQPPSPTTTTTTTTTTAPAPAPTTSPAQTTGTTGKTTTKTKEPVAKATVVDLDDDFIDVDDETAQPIVGLGKKRKGVSAQGQSDNSNLKKRKKKKNNNKNKKTKSKTQNQVKNTQPPAASEQSGQPYKRL
ncbi:hypothetical protein SAMD00019534_001090 [Acytostelium subglobosum LB1]|uniref:hypothetical protein n=1 Tax=Acytostelium subglobosum LB1 TaxID=1410327 RepID=UPI000644D1CB|nr:hypothetical protein SAMD00019534_001090 [Acytostelium subglobosum LB1]GAM16934.1 hypothetical protein SAMD00019534_001090 [Acytostelium subglobosum LB1]|eukprot:XP_012758996.1 hypothetical protein SAMD00019534_001090 [Acytostelium subglobosum LB1]